MIRYKMFEREITSGDHRSYHVCVNNFGSNFNSKSKFHPIDEALSKILNDCGLDSNAINKKVGSYSKGMRQKVGIAIAFAKKAKVLLLDEPASGLDPLASTELSSTLKSLAKKGTAVLMASHDIFRVRETCDRIGILKNGSLIDQMVTSKVTTNELEKIYIDYMRG